MASSLKEMVLNDTCDVILGKKTPHGQSQFHAITSAHFESNYLPK